MALEYFGNTSLKVKKNSKKSFLNLVKNFKLTLVFKSFKIINNTFRFQDMLSKYVNSKVLSKFKCNSCNSFD